MDNSSLARLLDETASLLEIDAGDPFRIRSYRRAAEAVEQQTVQIATLAAPDADAKTLLAIPGIGKGMATNLRDLVATGTMPLRDELLAKYGSKVLELLNLPGMGPKTVALVHSALGVTNMDQLEAAGKAGKLNDLPRLGEKFTAKLLKGIQDYRQNSSRFRIDLAREQANRIAALILAFPGIDTVTPAGSLRRGRETVGDLDLLATGPACEPDVVAAAVEHVATLPLIHVLLARGQNKVTFTLENNLQVDVRLLPRQSYGAAMQYFTGSKYHNVALRQRALKMGMTLSEYALARLDDNTIVASRTEEEIYNALGLDYIPPELRENNGEIEAAASQTLPTLITLADLHGDLHMHTTETDGTATIRQMAEAAIARGHRYIAITDHSKALAMTNGMDDTRALAHAQRVREVNDELAREFSAHTGPQWEAYEEAKSRSSLPSSLFPLPSPFRIFTGVEVDILADGELDLADETLTQLDIVIASIHSRFDQPKEVMTARILRALDNPYVRILAHPTGRLLLQREPFSVDLEAVLRRAAELGVAVEHNAAPARTDLSDANLRLAKSLGSKIIVNTDAHSTAQLDHLADGIVQLRRAWLTAPDVLNTAPTPEAFLAQLRPRPSKK